MSGIIAGGLLRNCPQMAPAHASASLPLVEQTVAKHLDISHMVIKNVYLIYKQMNM